MNTSTLPIASYLEKRRKKKAVEVPHPSKTFRKTGDPHDPTEMGLSKFELVPGDINLASGWVLLDDIGNKKMQIPEFITHVVTLQRPDIFLYSKSAKRTIIIELTCPNEDRFEISKEIKEKRYEDLQKTSIANNFDCNVFTIEVGVRGNVCADQVNIWTKTYWNSNEHNKGYAM